MIKLCKELILLLMKKGIKKAVLIDLEKWGDIWEDFYDILISKQRETVAWFNYFRRKQRNK